VSPFKGVKPGDIIEVTTKNEHGYALVETVTERGVGYVPIGGEWQRKRVYREPCQAHQIKGVWRRLSR
jgi:hypothetical protein